MPEATEVDEANAGSTHAERLESSWRVNAQAWTHAVRTHRIASRRAGTDAAIIDAVLGTKAHRVLDLGCGEGWMARALVARGCDVVGVDASPELIAAARAMAGARYEIATYAELASRQRTSEAFDAGVFNFALLGEDVHTALRAARQLLRTEGALVVQTVHPWSVGANAPYADGWRIETFDAFGGDFSEPMPWYFRTLGSWLEALLASGFVLGAMVEPLDVATGQPLSLLLRASSKIDSGLAEPDRA